MTGSPTKEVVNKPAISNVEPAPGTQVEAPVSASDPPAVPDVQNVSKEEELGDSPSSEIVVQGQVRLWFGDTP